MHQESQSPCRRTYQHLEVHFVMKDCDSKAHATARLKDLLPQYPDENTKHCESWVIIGSEEEE